MEFYWGFGNSVIYILLGVVFYWLGYATAKERCEKRFMKEREKIVQNMFDFSKELTE